MLVVTSCSLPPRESWEKIRREGLIPVMLAGARSGQGGQAAGDGGAAAEAGQGQQQIAEAVEGIQGQVEGEPREAADEGAAMVENGQGGRYPTARPIPGSTSYVFSPFEEGDKPVDVSTFGVGVKARCPYTGKIFIVPDFSAVAKTGDAVAVAEVKTASAGAGVKDRQPDQPQPTLASDLQDKVEFPTVSGLEADTPAPSLLPAPVLPTSPGDGATALAEKPADDADEVLEGTLVSGRPGFVRSPYAGSNQLVDITGMLPGQEVRCPYSGKLFRIPGSGEVEPAEQDPAAGGGELESAAAPGDGEAAGDGGSLDVPAIPEPEEEPEADTGGDGGIADDPDDGGAVPKLDLPVDATGIARPEPPKPPATEGQVSLPVAKRIAGKVGLVRSPYGSDGQLVDVTGKAPGSQVLCPFTGKPFIVPK